MIDDVMLEAEDKMDKALEAAKHEQAKADATADAVEAIPGVKQVDVEMTFQPQWGMDMMSDEARLELGFM